MGTSISEKKEKLRSKYLEKRNTLSENSYSEKCEKIYNNTRKWVDSLNVNHIHCYLSMDKRHEVKTDSIIQWLIRNHFTVSVPVVNFEENRLEHYQISAFGNFERNKWGAREPEPELRVRRTEPALFDVVFVPVVASDPKKNRLGYGKGFYDRFLSETPAIKAGLVFDICISENEIPTEKFDIKMDLLISDQKIIS